MEDINSDLFNSYVGIEYDDDVNGRNICLEFNVSLKVFAIALLLSKVEEQCGDDTNDKKDDKNSDNKNDEKD
jgi:hypothetical protein